MPFEFAASLLYQIPQRNYQLNDFKWNWIRIWWFLCLLLFFQICCQFQSLTVDDENKGRVFFLLMFLGAMSFCSSFNSMYNPIVRISEMKGNENNEISEKTMPTFFSYFFVFFFASKSFFLFSFLFQFCCNEKVRRLLECNLSKMWKLRSRMKVFVC